MQMGIDSAKPSSKALVDSGSQCCVVNPDPSDVIDSSINLETVSGKSPMQSIPHSSSPRFRFLKVTPPVPECAGMSAFEVRSVKQFPAKSNPVSDFLSPPFEIPSNGGIDDVSIAAINLPVQDQ